jgi:hypothetical protein
VRTVYLLALEVRLMPWQDARPVRAGIGSIPAERPLGTDRRVQQFLRRCLIPDQRLLNKKFCLLLQSRETGLS